MRHPEISVVLPVYNAAGTVGDALESLAAQSFADWECMVVDDGSTDASPETLREWERKEPRIRVVRTGHKGIVAALNRGIACASAQLIARMDADDECLAERLEKQHDFLAARPDVGVVSCLVEHRSLGKRQEGFARYVSWTNGLLTPEDHFLNRFVESPVIHPTTMFRKQLVEQYGGYREYPAWPEDYELWLRWMQRGVALAKAPETLYRWADRPDRLSRADERYDVSAFYECKACYLAAGPLKGCREVGIWGAGRLTRKRAELLTLHGIGIAFYVDIDPRRIGQTIHGRPVLAPEELAGAPDIPLIAYVASRGARDDIRARLADSRYCEGVNFWCAA